MGGASGVFVLYVCFSKQKTAYEMRSSDLSADVCSCDVMKRVQQTLNQNKQCETIKSNQRKVQEALKAKFGDKAQEAVAAKAAELGVSPSELGDLASKSPAMVLALFQTTGQSGPKPTSGSANIPPINHGQPPVGRPEKSVLSGATTKDQKAFLEKVRAEVYAKHGVEN